RARLARSDLGGCQREPLPGRRRFYGAEFLFPALLSEPRRRTPHCSCTRCAHVCQQCRSRKMVAARKRRSAPLAGSHIRLLRGRVTQALGVRRNKTAGPSTTLLRSSGREDNFVGVQVFLAAPVAGTTELSSRPELRRSVVEGPAVAPP